jgi:hypothetical protein
MRRVSLPCGCVDAAAGWMLYRHTWCERHSREIDRFRGYEYPATPLATDLDEEG